MHPEILPFTQLVSKPADFLVFRFISIMLRQKTAREEHHWAQYVEFPGCWHLFGFATRFVKVLSFAVNITPYPFAIPTHQSSFFSTEFTLQTGWQNPKAWRLLQIAKTHRAVPTHWCLWVLSFSNSSVLHEWKSPSQLFLQSKYITTLSLERHARQPVVCGFLEQSVF